MHRLALDSGFPVGQRGGLRCSSGDALDPGVRGSQVLYLPVGPRSGFLCHVLRSHYRLRLLAYQLLKSSDLLVNFCGQASYVLYLRGRQYRVALGCQAFYALQVGDLAGTNCYHPADRLGGPLATAHRRHVRRVQLPRNSIH